MGPADEITRLLEIKVTQSGTKQFGRSVHQWAAFSAIFLSRISFELLRDVGDHGLWIIVR